MLWTFPMRNRCPMCGLLLSREGLCNNCGYTVPFDGNVRYDLSPPSFSPSTDARQQVVWMPALNGFKPFTTGGKKILLASLIIAFIIGFISFDIGDLADFILGFLFGWLYSFIFLGPIYYKKRWQYATQTRVRGGHPMNVFIGMNIGLSIAMFIVGWIFTADVYYCYPLFWAGLILGILYVFGFTSWWLYPILYAYDRWYKKNKMLGFLLNFKQGDEIPIADICKEHHIKPMSAIKYVNKLRLRGLLDCTIEGNIVQIGRFPSKRDDRASSGREDRWSRPGGPSTLDFQPLQSNPRAKRIFSDQTVDSNIEILRESENIRGYVRMKTAILNQSQSVITNVGLELIFDNKIFKLDKIEPEYEMRGNKADIGIINIGEKKTVAFYLDPQICTSSSVDAIVSYRDSTGKFHTTSMRSKDIKVICPIFFTQETANTAMLKNLVSSILKHQDSRVYSIPKGLSRVDAFEIAKSAVSGRSIQFVREFSRQEPYRAEAWYYGVTKVKKIQTVIKVSVDSERDTIQIFASTSNEDALTGLLAELGHDLTCKLKDKGMRAVQVTNVTIKDSVLNKTALLFDESAGSSNVDMEDSIMADTAIGEGSGPRRRCPACRRWVSPGDGFCTNCGTRIGWTMESLL